jgi:glycosyltransferase involved in cell wall biosynthesis
MQVFIDVSAGVVAFSTGIQRVIRQMVRNWPTTEYQLIVWDDLLGKHRQPLATELSRLGLESKGASPSRFDIERSAKSGDWLLIPDFVHQPSRRQAIAELVEQLDMKLGYFAHDCVPVTAPETTIVEMTPSFSDYVLDMARADLVFTNSTSTSDELGATWQVADINVENFPSVISVRLPSDLPRSKATTKGPVSDVLKVLCIGSSEPRKNQGAVLVASERLWQQGLDFQLRLVGSRSWSDRDEQNYLEVLIEKGRDIERHIELVDSKLVELYEFSDLLVFPSIHEGFGIPIVEALGFGLPVITGRFGSTGQIASEGGCVVIDPRSDRELEDAMRNLLTNAPLRAGLRDQALARPQTTSKEFVNELRRGLKLLA